MVSHRVRDVHDLLGRIRDGYEAYHATDPRNWGGRKEASLAGSTRPDAGSTHLAPLSIVTAIQLPLEICLTYIFKMLCRK